MHDTRKQSVPLCIDLDGTLVQSDLLFESLLLLLSHNPFYVFLLPLWLLKGKAAFKDEVASRVTLDASTLPYDERVLELLRSTRARPRVLCTASNTRLATAVSDHLGLFEEVISSDGVANMSGAHKGATLAGRFGERGFDYAGNHAVDLNVWARSREAWVVNSGASLAKRAADVSTVAGHIPLPRHNALRTWLRALRLHQWLKNLLVFLPLLASHRFFDLRSTADTVMAFFAFGLCASGVYVLNDLLDLPADRKHPRKRLRPFASGQLQLKHGLVVALLLAILGFALASQVNALFLLVLATYYALTLAYSLRLKRIVMVDVILLAALYTIRIVGGSAAISVQPSFWLLAFSMFVFLSLAMLKRYTELNAMLGTGKSTASGRGYTVEDLALIQSLGAAAGYLAVLVLALYINSPESTHLYRHPKVLWLICPVMLYWMSRVWIVAHRGEMHDDPVVYAAKDNASRWVIAICGILAIAAT